jgi:hypothetical protein
LEDGDVRRWEEQVGKKRLEYGWAPILSIHQQRDKCCIEEAGDADIATAHLNTRVLHVETTRASVYIIVTGFGGTAFESTS